MNKRKLPILVDQAVGSVLAEATDKANAFERLLRKQTRLSCTPGCSNCCHLPVEISILEAITIHRYLVARGRWTPTLVTALRKHGEKTTFLAPAVWLLARIPCPLLSDHKCTVYDVRPFHCRTMWAMGDPYYCDGQNFGPETTLVAKDEVMASFWGHEELMSKQTGMPYVRFPVGKALLLAEKIVSGAVSVRDILSFLAYEESIR